MEGEQSRATPPPPPSTALEQQPQFIAPLPGCTLAWLHPQPLCAKTSYALAWAAVKASSLILISDPRHVFMPEPPS